jgi:hypothetical protein
MSSARRAGLIALAALVAAPAACRQITGVSDLAFEDAGAGGSSSGSDGGSGGDAGPLCQSVTYPDPVDASDDPSDAQAFTVAIRSIDLGEDATADNPVGLNIDKLCTCLGDGASCKSPSYANEDHCDDQGGVDNAAATLFSALSTALPADKFGSAYFSSKAEQGSWTLLLRVTGYNGQLDDARVTVAIYAPAGLQSSSKSGSSDPSSDPCQTDPDAGPAVQTIPCWNGYDVWRVSDSSVGSTQSIDEPLYVDANAYVSTGFLVASMSELSLAMGGEMTFWGMKVVSGTLVGALQSPQVDGLGFRIVNGTISARWRLSDVFQTLSTFSAEGQNLCKDDEPIYSLFKERVCASTDISSKLGGVTLECDSLSFGMRMQTFPVKLGDIAPIMLPLTTCPPEFDPATDTCGT